MYMQKNTIMAALLSRTSLLVYLFLFLFFPHVSMDVAVQFRLCLCKCSIHFFWPTQFGMKLHWHFHELRWPLQMGILITFCFKICTQPFFFFTHWSGKPHSFHVYTVQIIWSIPLSKQQYIRLTIILETFHCTTTNCSCSLTGQIFPSLLFASLCIRRIRVFIKLTN